jgi:hypothetical protein
MLLQHAACDQLSNKGMQYRMRYNKLPGQQAGYMIMAKDYEPEFNFGGVWDFRDYNEGTGPIKPMCTAASPASRTTWDTAAMLRAAQCMSYSDSLFLAELNHRGLDDRSHPAPGVRAVPNYPNFYKKDQWLFAQEKLKSKLSKYEIPRLLSYGCRRPPFSHMWINPRNLASKPGPELDSADILRLTSDLGAPRSHGADGQPGFRPAKAKDPGPLSVNGGTNREDRVAFPPLRFLRLREYVQQVARQLISIRAIFPGETLPEALCICQGKDDAAAYYEQGPVASRCDPHNVTFISPDTAYVDPRGCFGHEAWPDIFNRITFFLNFTIKFRANRRQQSIKVPPELERWLRPWAACRRQAGGTDQWFVSGAYFDDFADASFKLFFENLQEVKLEVFTEFRVEMSAKKAERHVDEAPMALLGLMLHVLEGVLAHDLSKARRYQALAAKLVATARKSGWVPNEMMDRLEGQFRFCSEADPGLVGDLLVIRAALGTNLARRDGRTRVSEQACRVIERMAKRMQLGMAVCFQPRMGLMGGSGLPILFGWTDASGDVKEPKEGELRDGKTVPIAAQMLSDKYFFGWGGIFYLEGTNTVFFTQQFITFNARKALNDSTAVECFATNEALCIMARVRDRGPIDIIQLADNQADVGISNTGKPKQVAERVLFSQRVHLRDTMPPTLVSAHHVLRHRMEEGDLLSRYLLFPFLDAQGLITDPSPAGRVAAAHLHDLQMLVDTRFGCHMQLRPVAPEPWPDARARLAVVVRAKGSAGADGLCSLGESNAVTRPWPRRTVSDQIIFGNTTGGGVAHASS